MNTDLNSFFFLANQFKLSDTLNMSLVWVTNIGIFEIHKRISMSKETYKEQYTTSYTIKI